MITIICLGKLKENYFKEAEKEYLKRLSKFVKINIIEIKECKDIIKYIKDNCYLIALDIKGLSFSSESFSKEIEQLQINGISNIIFVIGGASGLSQEILNTSNLNLSFSKMTFPYQIARILLVEQIYRAYKIMNNETYHK